MKGCEKILDAIKTHFYTNALCSENFGMIYFWKWVSTRKIADYTGESLRKTRYLLNKLEKIGKVESKRGPNRCLWSLKNRCLWSLKNMKGYKQHPLFRDYFEHASKQEMTK